MSQSIANSEEQDVKVVRLSAETHARLNRFAKSEGRTIQYVADTAVRLYLDKQKAVKRG